MVLQMFAERRAALKKFLADVTFVVFLYVFQMSPRMLVDFTDIIELLGTHITAEFYWLQNAYLTSGQWIWHRKYVVGLINVTFQAFFVFMRNYMIPVKIFILLQKSIYKAIHLKMLLYYEI